jgi:hypothetical protein
MSFDLVALETMVAFDGYEYAANNFNAPGTYESRYPSFNSLELEVAKFELKQIQTQRVERLKRGRRKLESMRKLASATPEDRLRAFKYMCTKLPFVLVKFIIKLILESSNLTIHPITGELVNRDQMQTYRIIFFKMFRQPNGATADQYFLWNKNPTTEITDKFCHKCGEPRAVYRFRAPMRCLDPANKTGCSHPAGNYYCHRAVQIMGGYCWDCIQIVNVRGFPRFA